MYSAPGWREMPDFLSTRERSALMSRIRGKNTAIELTLFKLLRKQGIRFRRHVKALPGKPDVVVADARACIYVDGEFWHGRSFAQWRTSLAPYWRTKIETNIARDRRQRARLRRLGWRVMRLWGRDIQRAPDKCLERVVEFLKAGPRHEPKDFEGATCRHRPICGRQRYVPRLRGGGVRCRRRGATC